METCYWIPTIEEAEEFVTYTFELHPIVNEITRFMKKSNWNNTVPSENPDIIKEQQRLYNISNREDLYVLEKEKEAFEQFYLKLKKEIEPYN